MAKSPTVPIEVTCPCCEAKLTVDTELAVVLSHVAPPKAAPDVDISDAARILAEQARKREDKFRDSWEAESKKEDVLNRKFEELFKNLPVDYFWMFIYNHMPHDKCMRSLELLTEKVWPNFTDAIKRSSTAPIAATA